MKYSGRLLIFAILLGLLPFVQSIHAGDKTEVVNDFENFISDGNFL